MSHPAAARGSPPGAASAATEQTAPPERAAKGTVCPRCGRRFDEGAAGFGAGSKCPDDGSPLVRAADMAAADGDPMLGRVLAGRFTILAKLGAGSMGTVYRAKQAPIGREVAVKILRSDRAIDEVSRARFLREARANSVLTSPNTVTVFDFGQSEGGDFYLAMELLEGESLGARIKRQGRIGVDAAVDTAKQALRSLSEAHAKGIIHRDLKPDNLFFARVKKTGVEGSGPHASPDAKKAPQYEEIVKVLDFGIAKMLVADGELAMNAVETQAGTVFGTPRYMSPEQAQGKPLDARSDLYSLGVILYHMLSGRPPFTDDDAIVVMARHIKTPPRPLSEVAAAFPGEPRIPPELEALVMRVLSKEPDKRPESADALVLELSRVQEAPVLTSGVRKSLPSASGNLKPVAFSEPPPAPAMDTLSVAAAMLPSRARRWIVPAVAIGLLAAVAFAIVAFSVPSSSRGPSPATSAAAVTPTVTAPAAAPATATAAATVPEIAASALPRPAAPPPPPAHAAAKPPRPSRPSHAAAPSKPAPSVGYGYLE